MKKMISVQSPGRINLIGEHTDYNGGFVLPAAIDKKTVFQLHKNGTADKVQVIAVNLGERYAFDLSNFHPIVSGWQNYVMGVVHELQQLGAKLTGFDATFEGNVPIGSGMSSSASLECSLAYGLNELFELGFDKWQLIKACQMAEHNFVGIKCGIMDQFASVMGKQNQVMLLDCRSLDFHYFPLDLEQYQLLLLNSNVTHSLGDSEYNARRAACEKGVQLLQKYYPEILSLRDIKYKQFLAVVDKLPVRIASRCRHIILENNRVLAATAALQVKNFQQLGQLMYQSHYSLQHDYEVSCPELDFLVQQTRNKDYILGSRMMGGGFGGCTINIVEKKWVDAFIDLVAENYRQQFGIDLMPYAVAIDNGVGVVEIGCS